VKETAPADVIVGKTIVKEDKTTVTIVAPIDGTPASIERKEIKWWEGYRAGYFC
jgi:hypothetical protein